MNKKHASVSLDLDNKWSYLKVHGDEGWSTFPSYLDLAVPRMLDFFAARDLKITFFVVGQDAALEKNHDALQAIADAGHEIGNHSFHHEPWLHRLSLEETDQEFEIAEKAIFEATGKKPVGFRGPGFSFSENTLRVLARRGYVYDCTSFPTYLGPVARAYYFLTGSFDKSEKKEREKLFGSFKDGFKTLRPHLRECEGRQLVEIPVTTMPIFKVPIHMSYLNYLSQFSQLTANTYVALAVRLLKLQKVGPSFLLHPLDFIGCDDDSDLAFFPGMNLKAQRKIDFLGRILDQLENHFELGNMLQHAELYMPFEVKKEKPRLQPALN